MKELRKLIIALLLTGLCFACSESDEFFEETGDALKAAKVLVEPSSETDVLLKAQEDWNNINEALQNAGPGETVQLAEGLFYLHQSLVVWDFDGTLKGAGKGMTTIQTAPGNLFDVSSCPPLNWPWGTVPGHFVICFPYSSDSEGGTVTVSDLTVHVSDPSTPWGPGNNRLQAINVHNESLIVPGDLALSNKIPLNVFFKNLSVLGGMDDNGYILNVGLAAFGASSGNFEAKNCDLTNVGNGINPHVFCGENSVITMKNCKIENTIVASYSFLVSSYNIIGNELNNVGVIGLQLFTNNPGVTFDIPENTYSAIKDNLIQMNTFDPNGPAIFGVRMNHVDVHNNVISGSCGVGITVGMYIGMEAGACENWSIKDNDFCDLVLTHTNLPEGTTIELNYARNCEVKNNANQVVGGGSATDPSNLIGEGMDCN
jgi:hypothetical protein